ncbi:MAG: AHH domain-containing protein [Planctomycetaceae bacterium]|nr:AHH domain-containing protein [Planctomycetaceae bacterium]
MIRGKDLRVGDVFLGANGELSTLTNIVRVEQDGGIAVFNFTVEGNHNYFILAKEYEYGQTCVLVHNTQCNELHHFASNKNKAYTPEFKAIASKYNLKLGESWNTAILPHRGRHAKLYHDFVLAEMQKIDMIAKGDKVPLSTSFGRGKNRRIEAWKREIKFVNFVVSCGSY